LSETLKALSDPNRLRILNLLDGETLCVCDLEEILQLNQSNLSRHLAKLKQTGLVSSQKKGLFMHYTRRSLTPPYGPVVESLYRTMAADPVWAADRKALADRQACDPESC